MARPFQVTPASGTSSPGPKRQLRSSSSPAMRSTVVLARWRLRQTLGMLLVTGVGMIVAVMIVCAVPLYSQVATTAGLHSILTAAPDSPTVTVHATMAGISPSLVTEVSRRLNPFPSRTLSPYLSSPAQFSVQSQGFTMLSPQPANPNNTLALLGYSMERAAAHANVIEGRLPQQQSSTLEIAITSQTANALNVHVGSVIVIKFSAYTVQKGNDTNEQSIEQKILLHVVGIYSANVASDAFWHGASLNPVQPQQPTAPSQFAFSAITSNDTLLSTVDNTLNTLSTLPRSETNGVVFSSLVSDLYWYYRLDSSRLTINNLDDLSGRLITLQSNIADTYGTNQENPNYPYIQSADVSSPTLSTYQGPGTLEQFRNRIDVAQIPVTILLIEIVGLVLFFVSMMAELLVERQSEAIAVLRSRGASKRQVFGSFFMQGAGLGLLAFLLGPLLAFVAVYLLTQWTLGADGQSAFRVISGDPLGTILFLGAYAALAVLFAVLASSSATYRAIGFDVLAMRRESARSTTRPFWQRFQLDIVAIIIALTGYGLSFYLNRIPGLDAQTQTLVKSPLALIAPTFLLLAGVLILLRIFPLLLRLGATLATRSRGATAVLALGQMSRAPQQSVRMTLLLALATAFAIFSLIFTASQFQHALDIAAYRVGADFSGTLSDVTSPATVAREKTLLKNIRGVTSVTIGYTGSTLSTGNDRSPIDIRAVDADTFAQTAIWNDSRVPLQALMQQLASQRQNAGIKNAVPAIVDALTWNRLNLSPGAQFSVQANDTIDGTITCRAIAEVPHIPTVNDSTDSGDSTTSPLAGGILVDYQSYAAVYFRDIHQVLSVNSAWLRTSDDAASLATIRDTLTKRELHFTSLLDRRALIGNMSSDPLYLDLASELALGASTALVLALLGSLLSSWLNARNRLTNFSVLRALGTSPGQVAKVLIWEQSIIYITAIVLGIAFGALLSATVIPSLVFTSVPASGATSDTTNADFYALQHILPIRLIVPLSLVLVLIVLVGICSIALSMMIRVVSRPALGQALRINED